jgi:hypothetical protein
LNFLVLREIAYILRRADEGDEEGAAERGLAERLDDDARAGLIERGEVGRDLSPVGDTAVVAGREAELRGGRGQRNRSHRLSP